MTELIAAAASREALEKRIREHMGLKDHDFVELKPFITVPNSFMVYINGRLHERLRMRYSSTHMARWRFEQK